MASSGCPPSWEIKEEKLKIDKDNKLGDGVYSNVFQAKWYKDDGDVVEVAAKVLPNHCANEKEIDILNELSKKPHPNIIKFHGAVRGNNITIVTELARKGSVYDYLKEQKRLKKRLSPQHIRNWALQAARAIQHLHENNVMHRDIKSPNFLIMDDGTLKLCDFGITNTDTTHTKTTGQKRGSLRWMAPELHDEKVSMKSDIFSYGTLIWEMVTCDEPYYQYQKDYILINKIMNEKEELKIPEDCPEDLQNLIKRCRQHDKDARPSIADILNELEGITEKEPIQESQDQTDTSVDGTDDRSSDRDDDGEDDVARAEEDINKLTLTDPTNDVPELNLPSHHDLQDWKNLLREPTVKDRLCSSIVPSTILLHRPDIITVHEEQQVKAMEKNEGHISAANLLIDFLQKSDDQNWPQKLMEALTPGDESPAILVSFLESEMSSYLAGKGSASNNSEDQNSREVGDVHKGSASHNSGDQNSRELRDVLEEIAEDLDFEFVAKQCKPGDMKALFRHLRMGTNTVEQVRYDNKHLGTCEVSIAVLQTWRKRVGREATRSALLGRCKSSGNIEVAHKLEDELKRKYISK